MEMTMSWGDDFEQARLAREAENQQRQERCKVLFRELDPMVQRLLQGRGDALWGSSALAPQYTIHVHRNAHDVVMYCAHWVLLHTHTERAWFVALRIADRSARTVDHFGVKCPDADWVMTADTTEQALKHVLIQLASGTND
jgi:hypothetical protein